MKRIFSFLLTSALLAILQSQAAPFAQWFIVGGSEENPVRVWGEGDEYAAVFESEDGHSVVFDEAAKSYVYAKKNPSTGRLEPTGIRVGDELGREGELAAIPLHLRDTSVAAAEEREARINEVDARLELSSRWSQLKSRGKRHRLAKSATDGTLPSPPSQETVGTVVALTLLIDFPSESGYGKSLAETVHPDVTKKDIEDLFNAESFTKYGNACSVRKYFEDVSCGMLCYTNVVVGWVVLPYPRSHYDDSSKMCGTCAQPMIEDAFVQLRADPNYQTLYEPMLRKVSLNAYSSPVAVNVYFAGDSSPVWNHGLWAHSSSMGYSASESWYSVDGVKHKIGRYEITPITKSPMIGTVCHESGHMVCGFPDLYHYDTSNNSNVGVGGFSLMHGTISNTNPEYIDPYLRMHAGWVTPKELGSANERYTVSCSLSDVWKWTNPYDVGEYYLIENRLKKGHDADLPAEGILIWRCNEYGKNTDSTYLKAFAGTDAALRRSNEVSLEQADGAYGLEQPGIAGDEFDSWHSGNPSKNYKNRFADDTVPCAKWANGSNSGLVLSGFSAVSDVMSFYVGEAPLVVVGFDANGGELEQSVGRYVEGETYGDLPKPVRLGYAFSGWRTGDGVSVTETSRVLSSTTRLVASWTALSESACPDISFGKPYGSNWETEVFLSSQERATSPQTAFTVGSSIFRYCGFKNKGSVATTSFDIRFSLYSDDLSLLKTSVYRHVNPLKKSEGTYSWGGDDVYFLRSLSAGRYLLRVTLDDKDEVVEYDETDNVREILFTVGYGWSLSHVIEFSNNGGSGYMPPQVVSAELCNTIAPNLLTRDRHTFAGWGLSPNGGVEYLDESKIRVVKDTVLYAQWTPNKYTITFYPNGSGSTLSGSVFGEADGKSKTAKVDVFADATINNVVGVAKRPGYTFMGWYTQRDAGGRVFDANGKCRAGGAFWDSNGCWIKNSSVKLYAQWKPITRKLRFYPNGGDTAKLSGAVFGDADGKNKTAVLTVTYDSSENSVVGKARRAGHYFQGWFTARTGGTRIYDSNGKAIAGNYWKAVSGGKTWQAKSATELPLYAQWKKAPSAAALEIIPAALVASAPVCATSEMIEGIAYLPDGETIPVEVRVDADGFAVVELDDAVFCGYIADGVGELFSGDSKLWLVLKL